MRAFWRPEVITCRPLSYNIVIRFLPLWIQCSLLHPRFAQSSAIRSIRLYLTPLNCFLAITTPTYYCFLPILESGFLNMTMAVSSFHFAAKSLEWGITGGYLEGRYYTRSELKPSLTPTTQVQSTIPVKPAGWREVAGWTTEQFFCLRGLQYGWGQKNKLKSPSLCAVILRLFFMNLINTSLLAFHLAVRDQGSPGKALEAIGIPAFRLRSFVAELLATLAFGFLLISGTEVGFCQLDLLGHVIHRLGKYVRIPEWILRSTDPTLFPPVFDSPHTATSLGWFWGSGWHQLFRRDYLMCGGYPASRMARKLGGGEKAQKICKLFGSFFVSGLMHEYVVHHFVSKSHPSPQIYFQEFPSSFAFFFVQPFGILLEPYIIPLIPRKMGGGWLWVLAFILMTATPFRNQYLQDYRLVDDGYKPLKQWNIWTVLIPGKVYKFD